MFVYDAEPGHYEPDEDDTEPTSQLPPLISVNGVFRPPRPSAQDANKTESASNKPESDDDAGTGDDDAEPVEGGDGSEPQIVTTPITGDANSTMLPPLVMKRNHGAREVHATWSFNQNTCNQVTELHIQ